MTMLIDDDVLEAARTIADQTHRTVGEVVSELARQGLRGNPPFTPDRGLPTFEVSATARPFTPEAVRHALDGEL
jgi:hypothetical protein